MEAGSEVGARQMSGFKDFYQSSNQTRVIAGRDLLSSTGFEVSKEGAHRVFLVTDKVIRETGLIDRVVAGVEDGGVEIAGVFDDVPQDSSTDVCDRCGDEEDAVGALLLELEAGGLEQVATGDHARGGRELDEVLEAAHRAGRKRVPGSRV